MAMFMHYSNTPYFVIWVESNKTISKLKTPNKALSNECPHFCSDSCSLQGVKTE